MLELQDILGKVGGRWESITSRGKSKCKDPRAGSALGYRGPKGSQCCWRTEGEGKGGVGRG